MDIQVFSGRTHSVALFPDGRLYGVGSNRSKQIRNSKVGTYKKPILIAKNVSSATVSDNYTAYVANKQIFMIGTDPNGIGDFFPDSDCKYKSVYASQNNNFWAIDESKNVYYWGNRGSENNMGALYPPYIFEQVCSLSGELKIGPYKYHEVVYNTYVWSKMSDETYFGENTPDILKKEFYETQTRKKEYRDLCEMYGSRNLSCEISFSSDEHDNPSNVNPYPVGNRRERILYKHYKAVVYRTNKFIIRPVLLTLIEPEFLKLYSPYAGKHNVSPQIWLERLNDT